VISGSCRLTQWWQFRSTPMRSEILTQASELALPDRFLSATSDDAPESASEKQIPKVAKRSDLPSAGDDGRRRQPGDRRSSQTGMLAHPADHRVAGLD
jgi:hypothetical protein